MKINKGKKEWKKGELKEVITSIVTNHKNHTFWYILFKAIEEEDTTIKELELPEFDDLSEENHYNNSSIFAINQAIHFGEGITKQYYILIKCSHISMLHGEWDFNYYKSAPYLSFLDKVLEENCFLVEAVEAKLTILASNPEQEEYNLYREWVYDNIPNLHTNELPLGLQTGRIMGGSSTLNALIEFISYPASMESELSSTEEECIVMGDNL